MKKDEPNDQVRLAATNALFNSLEFTKANFDREGERHFIMQVVCEATQANSEAVREKALQCLVRIMQLYYQYMDLYMAQALFAVCSLLVISIAILSRIQSSSSSISFSSFFSSSTSTSFTSPPRPPPPPLAFSSSPRPPLFRPHFLFSPLPPSLPRLLPPPLCTVINRSRCKP